MSNMGDDFQAGTKYVRGQMTGGQLDFSSRPEAYKEYPCSKLVNLPFIEDSDCQSLFKTINSRKSVRRFSDEPISGQQLSQLLWASTGITHSLQGLDFRAAPSAGALYPIETYLCINRVQDISPGIYHYSVRRHKLETLEEGDFGEAVAGAALDQQMCEQAAVVFIWSSVFDRSKWKYKQRAYRYVYLDAGHIAGNLALAATAIGLESCHIAALYDDEANKIIDVDGTAESVIYMTVVGNGG